MKNRKIFRLFISSTFNDFKKEREALQSNVFPHLKSFCSKKGYKFQPIDLRWGIENEAQIDQKTLELCLNEVRSCKSYPHPNFLVMIGDRYGWIPLPNVIDKNEFETLLSLMSLEEVSIINKWFFHDNNQLPASYTLKERRGEFELFEIWNKVEDELRSILQKAALNSTLSKEQIKKYFLSATEAEVEEGIIPFLDQTQYQKSLLKEIPELLANDVNNIFGFFRDVAFESKKSEKFIADDYAKAQLLKAKVKSELPDANYLHSETIQDTKDTLDEDYITQFVKQINLFLESKIEAQFIRENIENYSPLTLELEAQNYYAHWKRQNFIGQESLLQSIYDYITNDNPQSLIIYGESGKGKSALIAKAIEEVKCKTDKKVVFRFIGATTHSSSTKEILTSIFSELGIDLESEENKTDMLEDLSHRNLGEISETFEQFSYRMLNEISNIQNELVFFIDAVDQLDHEDQFLWLPSALPPNLKIIISVLSDTRYEADSRYLDNLLLKSQNTVLIKFFEKPVKLLSSLLKKENRTIQKHQEEYFLQQYEKVGSPFYVYVAAQEMKFWKSEDLVVGQVNANEGVIRVLADSQLGITADFIRNLSSSLHHNEKLVQKVLGYIYASYDGLSETEIFELLSCDEGFVQEMAPATWHENLTKEIPSVIWTRLYAHLRPFISHKYQDGVSLLYFFHREFEQVIHNSGYRREQHQGIIANTLSLVEKVQNEDFTLNRWGKILANLTARYKLDNVEDGITSEVIENVASLDNEMWKLKYLDYLLLSGVSEGIVDNISLSIIYLEFGLALSENKVHNIFNQEVIEEDYTFEWTIKYTLTVKTLMYPYALVDRYDDAFKHIITAYQLSSKLYELHPKIYDDLHCRILNDLGYYHFRNNDPIEAIKLLTESLKIQESYVSHSGLGESKSLIKSLSILSLCYDMINEYDKAIELGKEAVKLSRYKYLNEQSFQWDKIFIETLINLSRTLLSIRDYYECLEFAEEAFYILEKKRLANKKKWIESFSHCLTIIAEANFNLKKPNKAEQFYLKACTESKNNYKREKSRWAKTYATDLNNLGYFYLEQGEMTLGLIPLQKSAYILESILHSSTSEIKSLYSINQMNLTVYYIKVANSKEAGRHAIRAQDLMEDLYDMDKTVWGEKYSMCLNNLGLVYTEAKDYKQALKYEHKALVIRENLYNINPAKFTELYLMSLNNLSTTYSKLKLPDKAIPLLFKTLDLMENSSHYNKDKYHVIKIKCLHDLSFFLFDKNDPTISIAMLENGKKELNLLYLHDRKWETFLLKFINGLIIIYGLIDDNFQVRKLKIELEGLKK